MWIILKDVNGGSINLERVDAFEKGEKGGNAYNSPTIEVYLSRKSYSYVYAEQKDRDIDYEKMLSYVIKQKKGGLRMDAFKEYFKKHQDGLISLAIVLVLDHFIFDGSFRDRIKMFAEKMLGNTEKKLLG